MRKSYLSTILLYNKYFQQFTLNIIHQMNMFLISHLQDLEHIVQDLESYFK